MAIARRYFTLPELADNDARIVWLKARLQECEEDLAAGKRIVGWNAGDASANHQIDKNLTLEEVRRRLLNDLCILDPDHFDAADFAPIKRTVPRYL